MLYLHLTCDNTQQEKQTNVFVCVIKSAKSLVLIICWIPMLDMSHIQQSLCEEWEDAGQVAGPKVPRDITHTAAHIYLHFIYFTA